MTEDDMIDPKCGCRYMFHTDECIRERLKESTRLERKRGEKKYLHGDVLSIKTDLAIAVEALKFYAEFHSWKNDDNDAWDWCVIVPHDISEETFTDIWGPNKYRLGGKTAREALAKIEEIK